jgi:hypothetical protein
MSGIDMVTIVTESSKQSSRLQSGFAYRLDEAERADAAEIVGICAARLGPPEAANVTPFVLNLGDTSAQRRGAIQANTAMNVAGLKQLIAAQTGLGADSQSLVFCGRRLVDLRMLDDYNFMDQTK